MMWGVEEGNFRMKAIYELNVPGLDFPVVLKENLDRMMKKDGLYEEIYRLLKQKQWPAPKGLEMLPGETAITDYNYSKCLSMVMLLMYNNIENY